ncbi:hypothetical protein NXC14_PC00130 (plasmid) [Rhizobium sp. NXC14]|nr:hypothetical protein NXC14_PC00130 [Rhizobium sp. NXC14]
MIWRRPRGRLCRAPCERFASKFPSIVEMNDGGQTIGADNQPALSDNRDAAVNLKLEQPVNDVERLVFVMPMKRTLKPPSADVRS